jgi:hypothetical protein
VRDKKLVYGDLVDFHRTHPKSAVSKEWLMTHMFMPWVGAQRGYFGRVKLEKFLRLYGIKIDIV